MRVIKSNQVNQCMLIFYNNVLFLIVHENYKCYSFMVCVGVDSKHCTHLWGCHGVGGQVIDHRSDS